MFVCPKRIERDGRLVCFKGQTMTEAEAEALGLLETAEVAEPEPQTEETIEEPEAPTEEDAELVEAEAIEGAEEAGEVVEDEEPVEESETAAESEAPKKGRKTKKAE
jgi:hypothetical protein